MRTVRAILGGSAPAPYTQVPELPAGIIGIELELEGREDYPLVNGWERKPDGSLRNGMEYVFDGPQGGATALESIMNMGATLQQFPVEPTFRCSTHIHLDCRDLPLEVLERLILAYTITESIMFDHCDEYRRYSNFCVPYYRNTAMVTNLAHMFKQGQVNDEHRLMALGNWPKYSGLNLATLTRFGTVEFRGSHAMTTSEELTALAQRMLHLRRVAMENDVSSLEFVERLRNFAPSEIFLTGLKEGYALDEHLNDQCYANALMLAGTPWGEESSTNPYAESLRSRLDAVRAAPQTYRTNATTCRRYSLNLPSSMTANDIYRVYVSLRNIRGIRQPELSDFFARPENLSFTEILQQTDILHHVSNGTLRINRGDFAE